MVAPCVGAGRLVALWMEPHIAVLSDSSKKGEEGGQGHKRGGRRNRAGSVEPRWSVRGVRMAGRGQFGTGRHEIRLSAFERMLGRTEWPVGVGCAHSQCGSNPAVSAERARDTAITAG